jgi:Fe-S-cluster-containing dehydrogenase component
MDKWNLIIDVAECHNCHNCFISCKDEYIDNDIPGYSAPQPLHGHNWINILAKERGHFPMVDVAYVPTMCNHCDNAPCIEAGGGAVTKRDDGIVIIDPRRAVGRKDLVHACPYGAIWWNEALGLPQAWTFDAHLLDRGWKEPRCVTACPTTAIKSVKVSDETMAKIVRDEQLRPLASDLKTKPRVHYKNLHLYDSLFVGGCIVGQKSGVLDCIDQAQIELVKDNHVIRSALSDCFGEFKIDSLAENSGPYELRISHKDFRRKSVTTPLGKKSVVLEAINLT